RALNPATLSPVRRVRLSSAIGCLPPHRRTADATAVSSSAEFLSLRRFPLHRRNSVSAPPVVMLQLLQGLVLSCFPFPNLL
ncbi:unnamed protein product, partial [Musa acuminata var. zebrina]